jgi:hypothetical protein
MVATTAVIASAVAVSRIRWSCAGSGRIVVSAATGRLPSAGNATEHTTAAVLGLLHQIRGRANYWVYSIGLAIAWAIVLIITWIIKGAAGLGMLVLVFLGFCIGWISTTIARYLYPPPKRWISNQP